MKIKLGFCSLLLVLIFVSCRNENSYTVKGNIKGLQNNELYIVSSTDLRIDTIQAKSGKFTYHGVSQTVEPLVIYMENGTVWITVWVQNGEIFSLTGDANYPEMIMVKGGEINKLLTNFKKENLSLLKEKCDLRDKLSAHSKNPQEANTSASDAQFSSQIKNIDQILKTRAQDFIETNPTSIASLVMIQDYILDIENASDSQVFLDLITGEAKANKLYDKLQSHSLRDQQTKVKQPALDFSMVNMQKDTISLATFKNKYLILNFATSNCEFCEPEYSELLALESTFPEKDLAILTVSLDENAEDWKTLAKEKGIDWMQVIDTSGWASEMVSLYNVLAIPCNYLIDKDGIIIGSKISVDSIKPLLEMEMEIIVKN